MKNFADVPVAILCGGKGIFINETGSRINKALIEVAEQPMFIHVLRLYLRAGFTNFVLACGYQVGRIESVLVSRYAAREALTPGVMQPTISGVRCRVTIVNTGEDTTTGDRLKLLNRYLAEAPWFCATYSDTLSNVDLRAMADFHSRHGRIASLVAAQHPTRFRILGIRLGETEVRGFAPRPVLGAEPINGGFYFFKREIFDPEFLGHKQSAVVLEEDVFDRLVNKRELMAYGHQDAWQNLDSERDLAPLAAIANRGVVEPKP